MLVGRAGQLAQPADGVGLVGQLGDQSVGLGGVGADQAFLIHQGLELIRRDVPGSGDGVEQVAPDAVKERLDLLAVFGAVVPAREGLDGALIFAAPDSGELDAVFVAGALEEHAVGGQAAEGRARRRD